MRIIACEDKTDLRTINARHAFLSKVDKEFHLKNNQAVCYTNKIMTRFRLVFKFSNALFMCIPEIDEQSKYSIYLKISEQLSKLTHVKGVSLKFDFFTDYTKQRIVRQQKRKKSKKKAARKVKRPPRRIIVR